MNDVMSRLRAADPQPSTPSAPTDADVATVLAAARSAGGRHPAPPRRVGRRTVLLGAAATVVGAVAVPASGLIARPDRMPTAQAAQLKELARRVAALPTPSPNRDVIYRKIRLEAIDVRAISPDGLAPSPEDPFFRTKTVTTDEWWVPLWPNREQGTFSMVASTTPATPADAERLAALPAEMRKALGYDSRPPWKASASKRSYPSDGKGPGSMTSLTRSFVQRLPTDPAELESRIRKDPGVDDKVPPYERRAKIHYEVALRDLLTFLYSPPKLRAAVLLLLAEADGSRVKVVGARDTGEREALAIWWHGMQPGEEQLIDRETGLDLGQTWVLTGQVKRKSAPWFDDLRVGTILREVTVLEFAYVGKVGARP